MRSLVVSTALCLALTTAHAASQPDAPSRKLPSEVEKLVQRVPDGQPSDAWDAALRVVRDSAANADSRGRLLEELLKRASLEQCRQTVAVLKELFEERARRPKDEPHHLNESLAVSSLYFLAHLPQDRLTSVKDELDSLIDSALKGERHDPAGDINQLDLLICGVANPTRRSEFSLRLITLPGTNKSPQRWCARFLLEPERQKLRTVLATADLSKANSSPGWAITVLGRIGDVASQQVLTDQREKARTLATAATDADERLRMNSLIEQYDQAITWIDVQKKPQELLSWAFDSETKQRDPMKAWAIARALDLGVERTEVRRAVLAYLNGPSLGRFEGGAVKVIAMRLELITDDEAPDVLTSGAVD